MDSKANLKEQIELAKLIQKKSNLLAKVTDLNEQHELFVDISELSERLSELIIVMDNWISNGGFHPYE